MPASKKSTQPLRHLAAAVAKSQQLTIKLAAVQARVAELAKQIEINEEKPKPKSRDLKGTAPENPA